MTERQENMVCFLVVGTGAVVVGALSRDFSGMAIGLVMLLIAVVLRIERSRV